MGTILIHAGMPKSGSSTIQTWLRQLARGQFSLTSAWMVLLADAPDGRIRVQPIAEDSEQRINSGVVLHRWRDADSNVAAESARDFCRALDERAHEYSQIVVTAEGFAQVVWYPLEGVLRELARLTANHDVRIITYVRPQHTALEAAWRQWGFRSGLPAGRYLADRARPHRRYRYLAALHAARAVAPEIDFVHRPFRGDLLAGGDVVADFVQHGLRLSESPPGRSSRANVGLTLDLVNLLQAPEFSSLWPSPHHNAAFNRVKHLLSDSTAAATTTMSDKAHEGRMALQAWCHEQFADDNDDLFRELGIQGASFVPPAGARPDLGLLDELWAPPAAPEVRRAMRSLLEAALDAQPVAAVSESAADHIDEPLVRTADELHEVSSRLSALERRKAVRALRAVDALKRRARGR